MTLRLSTHVTDTLSLCPHIAHPINADFRRELEEAVIDAYHVQLVASEHDDSEDGAVII